VRSNKPDISVRILKVGLAWLLVSGLLMFVSEVVLRDVPGADRPILLQMLFWLAYLGLYPSALITLIGVVSWLDRKVSTTDE